MTIAHLEAELAVQLFDRSGREARPTAAARALEPRRGCWQGSCSSSTPRRWR